MQYKQEAFQNLLDEMDLFVGEHCCNRIYTKLMQTIVYLKRETSTHILNVPGAIENSIKNRKRIVDAILNNDALALKNSLDKHFIDGKLFYEHIISE